MASALHQEFAAAGNCARGGPAQLFQAGVFVVPVTVAGFIGLWRDARLRFCAITVTLVVVWVLIWIPGKEYYTAGVQSAVVACGSACAERWAHRGKRPRVRCGLLVAAPLVALFFEVVTWLPIYPVGTVSNSGELAESGLAGTIGWPQFAAAVDAQDAALTRAGERPTSVFAGEFYEAAAAQLLGHPGSLPPVLSGHNAYWTWGPGGASDRVVLVTGSIGLGQLSPYFSDCRVLSTFYPPGLVQNVLSGVPIGVCTGPDVSWPALWPHLKYFAASGVPG
jgi:hypothetical protein